MKRQIIAIALLTLSGAAQAQNTFINEQLTNNSQDVIGTSRFVGMGGAMEACGVVAQHRGHGFYVHAVLQRHGREGVAQVVKAYPWQSCSL